MKVINVSVLYDDNPAGPLNEGLFEVLIKPSRCWWFDGDMKVRQVGRRHYWGCLSYLDTGEDVEKCVELAIAGVRAKADLTRKMLDAVMPPAPEKKRR